MLKTKFGVGIVHNPTLLLLHGCRLFFLFFFQVITTIPTHKLPKRIFTFFSQPPPELAVDEIEGADELHPLESDTMGRRGQILWVRGLTRLQQQVKCFSFPSYLSPCVLSESGLWCCALYMSVKLSSCCKCLLIM